MLAQEGNPIAEAGRDVLAKITEMENKARDMGVGKVPYRRYLSLVGFKLPKYSPEINASTYLRGAAANKATGDSEDKPK